jgi:hypothetical protein
MNLTALASTLQDLFSTIAEQLARNVNFVRRQRQLRADLFAQTLVFNWIRDPNAPLEPMARDLAISHQAQRQRLGLLDRFSAT